MITEENILQEQLDYDRYKDQVKAMKFKLKLKEFVNDYISEHTFINSRSLAKLYLRQWNYKGKDGVDINRILHRLSSRFSKILLVLKNDGLLEKYNARQYKKVRKVSY